MADYADHFEYQRAIQAARELRYQLKFARTHQTDHIWQGNVDELLKNTAWVESVPDESSDLTSRD